MCTTLWHSHLRCLSRTYYEILRPVGCMKASIEQYGCSLDALMHPTGWETPPEEKATYHANYAANMDKIAKLKKAGVWDAWSETTNRRKDSDETAANMVTSTSMTGTDGKVAVTLDAPAKPAKDIEPVLQCLRLTTPDIKPLTYPSDAEVHFEELQKVLIPWFDYAAKKFMADMKNPYHCGEGCCGPWIENRWIFPVFLEAGKIVLPSHACQTSLDHLVRSL